MPGDTQIHLFDEKGVDISASPHSTAKGIILLGAGLITPDILFNNGLNQNILILYDLFESLGYTCILFTHKRVPDAKVLGPNLSRYRMVDIQELMMHPPATVHLYVEIAMSLDPASRAFFKARGARVVKLYLGNALNIDAETCSVLKSLYIPHHNDGGIDEIWTSPHYAQHLSYLCGINNVPLEKGRCVPYVWDRRFMDGAPQWQPHEKGWEHMDIIITEPNISFQKSYFYPLLLADAFARRCGSWKGHVVLLNADKLKGNAYFHRTVLPGLTLQKQGRIRLEGRLPIRDILAQNPSGLFLMHNWNNDYNYMLFELMDRGFPVLHNSIGWADIGYTWSVNAWEEAQERLLQALHSHSFRQRASYDCDAKKLAWTHAPQNPMNRALWKQILDT
jgi:hypothetical protein